MTKISCAVRVEMLCGESPVWCEREEALYWIDILSKLMFRLDPKDNQLKQWELPEPVYSFTLRERGGFLVAAQSGLAFLDIETGKLEFIGHPENNIADNRLNDGKCDPAGRFFVGSMHIPRTKNAGALYRLDPDLTWNSISTGVMVGNGLAWSPDGKTMYWSDSRNQIIYAFDFDPDKGEAENRRVFVKLTEEQGRPDGAAIDSEGNYWSACFTGGRVIKFSPDGRIIDEIMFPVINPTMCAFGGPDLSTLYVTSARVGLSKDELLKQPLAGSLFALRVDVPGVPVPKFKG